MSFSVSLNQKSVKQCEKNLRDSLTKVMHNRSLQQQIGDEVIQDIKYQSRRGQSIPNNRPFKSLKPSWIETRKQIQKVGGTHDTFSVRRSNITVSGQVLDSLSIKFEGKGKLRFVFKGMHDPYLAEYKTNYFRKTNGKRLSIRPLRQGIRTIGERISNEKLAGYIAENGRPFVGIRSFMYKRIDKLVLGYVRRSGQTTGFSK